MMTRLLIFSGYLLTLVSLSSAEEKSALRLWVPSAYSLPLKVSERSPYVKELMNRLQRPVKIQVYDSLNTFLEQCRQGQIDHAIVEKTRIGEYLKHCRFQLLAKASQPVYLYTNRDSGKYHLSEIRRIGVHALLTGQQLIRKELDPTGNRFRLVETPRLIGGLSDLLHHRIDGLVTLQGPINHLDGRIHSKLRILYRFKGPQTMYFLVSPFLDQTALEELNKLYQSPNDSMNQLLEEQFGLIELSPPDERESQSPWQNQPTKMEFEHAELDRTAN